MITHVAIWSEGTLYSLPKPNRHHHVIRYIYDKTGKPGDGDAQGFLDDTGRFLNRVDALAYALAHNQVKDPSDIRAGQLFSEDLW